MSNYKATLASTEKQDGLGRLQTIFNERYIYQIAAPLNDVLSLADKSGLELLKMERTNDEH